MLAVRACRADRDDRAAGCWLRVVAAPGRAPARPRAGHPRPTHDDRCRRPVPGGERTATAARQVLLPATGRRVLGRPRASGPGVPGGPRPARGRAPRARRRARRGDHVRPLRVREPVRAGGARPRSPRPGAQRCRHPPRPRARTAGRRARRTRTSTWPDRTRPPRNTPGTAMPSRTETVTPGRAARLAAARACRLEVLPGRGRWSSAVLGPRPVRRCWRACRPCAREPAD